MTRISTALAIYGYCLRRWHKWRLVPWQWDERDDGVVRRNVYELARRLA